MRTGPGLVFCRGAQDDGVAGGGEGVIEGSDVDFGPAVIVGEDYVGGCCGQWEEGKEKWLEMHFFTFDEDGFGGSDVEDCSVLCECIIYITQSIPPSLTPLHTTIKLNFFTFPYR